MSISNIHTGIWLVDFIGNILGWSIIGLVLLGSVLMALEIFTDFDIAYEIGRIGRWLRW